MGRVAGAILEYLLHYLYLLTRRLWRRLWRMARRYPVQTVIVVFLIGAYLTDVKSEVVVRIILSFTLLWLLWGRLKGQLRKLGIK